MYWEVAGFCKEDDEKELNRLKAEEMELQAIGSETKIVKNPFGYVLYLRVKYEKLK